MTFKTVKSNQLAPMWFSNCRKAWVTSVPWSMRSQGRPRATHTLDIKASNRVRDEKPQFDHLACTYHDFTYTVSSTVGATQVLIFSILWKPKQTKPENQTTESQTTATLTVLRVSLLVKWGIKIDKQSLSEVKAFLIFTIPCCPCYLGD